MRRTTRPSAALSDVHSQLGWMAEAGLEDCDCFFKRLHFAVLAGWRPAAG